MIQLLIDNPLLLLFTVAGLGFLLGRIKVAGVSLGVAAVLFVGLAIGSLHPDLKLTELLYQLGLVLFVYTIGLSSGTGFFASLQRKGLTNNLLVIGMLALGLTMTLLAHFSLGLKSTVSAGLFAGSLTNTPALASVLDYLKGTVPPERLNALLSEPVVGYSVTYPMGVIGMIGAIYVMQRWWKVDYADEARQLPEFPVPGALLQNQTIEVTRTELGQSTIAELVERQGWNVIFGRIRQNGQLFLAKGETRLQIGDLVSVVGAAPDVGQVTAYLGRPSSVGLEMDRSQLDSRSVFVSKPAIAGHRLNQLNVTQQYGALITRIRRGDVELVARGNTILELGDRVRVVAGREAMAAVRAFFGDSYRALSEIDILNFSLGLGLGLLLGIVPIPLPGGVTVKLGLAGGPLIVALILGAMERTGPIIWSLPYSANLTLRQVGLIMLLAGIGTRTGYAFVSTFSQSGGLAIFVAGAVITCITALGTLWIGYRVLKIPFGLLIGILAGLQTAPAVLGFALEQSDNDLPNIGYAIVYPVATILKIIFAQLILILFAR